MRKDKQLSQVPMGKYRIKNWPAFNAGLIARGDLMIWIDQCMARQTPSAGSGPCRCVRCRAFVGSLSKLTFPDLPIVHHTMSCRQAQAPNVVLPMSEIPDH